MTFRSQLEPSIKSYECFMFFKISDWKSQWTDGFLKDLTDVNELTPPPKKKTPYCHAHILLK